MQDARIGPWGLAIPDGWKSKESDTGIDYFEEPEGTKGMYVKGLELKEALASANDLAEYIQDVQFRTFSRTEGSNWQVMARRYEESGSMGKSALDLFDTVANYRVLSLVLCNAREAIQVTVHDYWCDNYSAKRDAFSEIEAAIQHVPGAA